MLNHILFTDRCRSNYKLSSLGKNFSFAESFAKLVLKWFELRNCWRGNDAVGKHRIGCNLVSAELLPFQCEVQLEPLFCNRGTPVAQQGPESCHGHLLYID